MHGDAPSRPGCRAGNRPPGSRLGRELCGGRTRSLLLLGGQSQGGIPPIGRDADAVYRALLEFKNNQRPAATVMHQHTKGYTDDELRRIAAVFAAAK